MRRFGLIGFPLGHSFSKGYFAEKFEREDIRNCRYDNYPIDSIEAFDDLIKMNPDLEGLNVTIPYKEAIMPYLDELDREAAGVGAVNTIRFTGESLIGYNTDVYGFKKSLAPLLSEGGVEAFILGTGGAAKAVKYVLEEMEIPHQFVSRKETGPHLTYRSLTDKDIADHRLIVNTTPLGMYPNVKGLPEIPYSGIGDEHLLYDLVYNPAETRFMYEGRCRGAQVKNGLEMLELQAERAWAIWNDY